MIKLTDFLTLIEYQSKKVGKTYRTFALCLCSCGTTKLIRYDGIQSHKVLSCGCHNKQRLRESVDTNTLCGKQFGRLTAISFSHTKKRQSYWNCLCSCGKSKIVRRDCLLAGTIASCGCLNKENGRHRAIENNKQYRLSQKCNPNIPMGSIRETLWSEYKDKKLSAKIMLRDKYCCKVCCSNKELQVHHIIPIKQNKALIFVETNLITLCKECHKKAHNGNWKELDTHFAETLTHLIEGE